MLRNIPKLRENFLNNGYILLTNYFTQSEGRKIQYYVDKLEEIKEERGKWMIYYEREGKNIKFKGTKYNLANPLE